MAKLPDINYRRNVPVIKSGQAAKNRTKVRNIYAAVGVVDRVVGELDQLVETDARLDAARRGNDAVRDYQTGVSELTQDFHSDTDMSPADYATRLNEVREQSIAGAGEGISTRGRKYFSPAMDNFRTQVNPAEMDLMQKAMTSRQIMQLDDLEKTAVATAGTSPQLVDEEAALYKEQVMGSDLPAAMKNARLEDGLNNMALSSVLGMARDQNLSGMNEMLKSDLYKELSLEQQRGLRSNIMALSQQIVNEQSQVLRNRLTAGDVGYKEADEYVTGLTHNMPGMSEAQNKDFVRANRSAVAVGYVNGLNRRDQFDTALKFLKSDEGQSAIADPSAYAAAMGAATTGAARGVSTGLNFLNNRVTNELASLQDGRAPDPTVIADLQKARGTPGLSESQKSGIDQRLGELDIWQEVNNDLQNIHSISDTDLVNMGLDAQNSKDTYEGEHYANYSAAQDYLTASTQKVLQQRSSDPTTYASIHDPDVAQSWDTVKEMAGYALSAEPEDRALYAEQAAMNYATFKRDLDSAVAGYGHSSTPRGIPVDGGFIAGLAGNLNSAVRANQLNSIGFMSAIFGEDAYDVGAQLTKEDPGIGGAVLFDLLGLGADRDMMIRGKSRLDRYGDAIKATPASMTDPEKNSGVEIPLTSVGVYAEPALGAMYTYAIGIASDAEILGGEFKQDTLTTARDAIFGEPFRINEYSESAIPYRNAADGSWASSKELKAKFKTLIMVPGTYEGTQPFYSDGTVASLSEALRYATPILSGEGSYRLDVPASSGYGTAGYLTNADGSPFELDISGVTAQPVSSNIWQGKGLGGFTQ